MSVLCLITAALYKEARSETPAAQLAVAHVVMARKTTDKTSVCRVIAKKHQFSWVKNGRVLPLPKASTDVDKLALERAITLSKRVLFGRLRSAKLLSGKYQYFNHTKLGKRYKTQTKAVKLGKLLFY